MVMGEKSSSLLLYDIITLLRYYTLARNNNNNIYSYTQMFKTRNHTNLYTISAYTYFDNYV